MQLSEKGEIKYSDLVQSVGHSTTTSRALSQMEKLGFIKREVLQAKYRPVVYSLTDKGRRLVELTKELTKLENI
jgi:DNA-binding HxlR family transcriptional regulator